VQAIQWAEQRLRAPGSSLVLVTHDRAFLEALATGILELDRDGIHMHDFSGRGSYQRFREVGKLTRRSSSGHGTSSGFRRNIQETRKIRQLLRACHFQQQRCSSQCAVVRMTLTCTVF